MSNENMGKKVKTWPLTDLVVITQSKHLEQHRIQWYDYGFCHQFHHRYQNIIYSTSTKKPQTNSPHLEGWPPQGGRDGYFPYPKEDARQSAVEVVYSFRTAFTRRSTFSRVFCPIIPH